MRQQRGPHSCFVSCAKPHQSHAIELKKRLQKLFPETIQFFIGVQSIEASERWHDRILEELRKADTLLVLLSPNTVNRPWLIFEAAAAMALRAQLIPLRFCGLSAESIPAPLTTVQSVDLTDIDQTEGVLRQMTTALPPKAAALASTARAIVEYFVRASDAPVPEPELVAHSAEESLRSLATLSLTQRQIFFFLLESGDEGLLESEIRAGCHIPYFREQTLIPRTTPVSLRTLPITPSEYYFRLRDLEHLGLLSMSKEDRYENRWRLRPEIARELKGWRDTHFPGKRP